jgi:hypothetical protein
MTDIAPHEQAGLGALPRFAAVVRTLEHRRRTVANLEQLAKSLTQARLITVDAETELAKRLRVQLARADRDIDLISTTPAREAAKIVRRIDATLAQPDWAVAEQATARLLQQSEAQQSEISVLTQDLGTFRLGLHQIKSEVEAAVQAGGDIGGTIKTTVATLDGIIGQAAQDAARGRYDTVAVAVKKTRDLLRTALQIEDPKQFDRKLAEVRKLRSEAELRDTQMALRAELFLITTSDETKPSDEIKYRVLLRRPSGDGAQESSLYDDSSIYGQDREQFRSIINDIASQAVRGIRARSAGAEPEALPDAPVRHIGLPAGTAPVVDDPASRLETVGRRMYSLLIPDAMQRLIGESDCALRVTSNDLELPWELMHDGKSFLSLRRPFARMPVGRTYPRRARPTSIQPLSSWQVLLIHSDPGNDLPDAASEVEAVYKLLDDRKELPVSIRVLSQKDATVDKVTEELSSGKYDLIHYAGHAGFDGEDAGKCYLLLHEHKKFEAERIQRILEGLPIVFLNACDSGQASNEDNDTVPGSVVQQAQGLASAFVYGGAQACVGALWPVFDDTARTLATSFYELLFGRRRVGDALCEARARCRAMDTDLTTWAAYALYGDPAYRLRGATPPSEAPATLSEPRS